MNKAKQSAEPAERFGYSPDEYKKFKIYGMRYLLLFSFFYCTVYCMRLNLTNAAPLMKEALGIGEREIGILTSTLFWTYGISGLINGRLSEIISVQSFLTISVIGSAVCNILLSFQSNIIVMAILWGINGFFQSMAWTPGMTALTKWWPGNTHGFATGFANTFSGFGQAVATLSVTLAFAVLPSLSWRAAFILPTAIPILMFFIYRLLSKPSPVDIGLAEYREDDTEKRESEEKMRALVKEKGILYPYRYVLSHKRMVVCTIISCFTGLIRYGLVTWIPLYFTERFGISITSGLLRSLALPVGMGAGTLFVPWITDRVCPDNRLPAAIVGALGGAAAIIGFVFLDPTDPVQSVVITLLLFIAGFFTYSISGTTFTVATDVGGRVFCGTATGVMNFAAYMGAAVQSALYGSIVEFTGWQTIFFCTAGFCILIVVLSIFGNEKKDKKDKKEKTAQAVSE